MARDRETAAVGHDNGVGVKEVYEKEVDDEDCLSRD